MLVLAKVVDKKIKVRVKCGVCNVKKLFMINWKKLKKIRQTYIDIENIENMTDVENIAVPFQM